MAHSRQLWYVRVVTAEGAHIFHALLTLCFSLSCGGLRGKMSLIPVVPENHSHVLAEFDCLDPLLSALRLDSGRLKVGL